MAKLSQPQIAALWIALGGNPAKADEASAVAMGESGGDTKIHTPGSCCYGLWQLHGDYFDINCATNAVCATKEAIKLSENGKNFGVGPKGEHRWEAWENGSYKKFTGGAFKGAKGRKLKAKLDTGDSSQFASFVPDFIPQVDLGPITLTPFGGIPDIGGAGDAINGITGGAADAIGNATGLTGISDAIKGISAFTVGTGELLLTPEGWVKLAKLIGGAIFVLWGIRILVREVSGTDPVKTGAKVAGTVAAAAALKK